MRHFPLGADSVSAVISLGVIEHFEDPWGCLSDSRRILRREGVLYLVVPYMNWLRISQDRKGRYAEAATGDGFYQFIMSEEEIQASLTGMGFRILEKFSTSAFAGLVDAFPAIRPFAEKLPGSHALSNWLNRQRWSGKLTGHVIHFVACKDGSG